MEQTHGAGPAPHDPRAAGRETRAASHSAAPGRRQPSNSGRLVAVLRAHGDGRRELQVVDTASGRPVDAPMPLRCGAPVAWLPDERGFYYVDGCPDDPRRTVRLHLIGRASAADEVVFSSPSRRLSVQVSADGSRIIVFAADDDGDGVSVAVSELYPAAPWWTQFRVVLEDVSAGPATGSRAGETPTGSRLRCSEAA